ncbi:MAG: HAMP domain-containing methyl-accepting chemotaxis protein [Dehalococcoidia bacterium]
MRWKLSLSLVGAVSAVVLVAGTVLIVNQRADQLNGEKEEARMQARTGAAGVAAIFETALAAGEITRDALFDTAYVEIPGTSPASYHTAFDAFTDEHIRAFEDQYVVDDEVVFAVAVDRNGYLPTHNTKYAGAVGGEPSRSKRMFNDAAGLAAARNTTEETLLQHYVRDSGEAVWDASAPIIVNGEHWGAFRVAFSVERTNAAVMQTTLEITGMLLALVVATAGVAIVLAHRTARSAAEVGGRIRSLQEHCVADLREAMHRLAAGDLTMAVTPVTPKIARHSRDEIGQLAAATNDIIDKMGDTIARYNEARVNLSFLIGDVKENALAVLDSAGELHDTSGQLAAASDQIAAAMSDVNTSSIQLADVAHESASEIERLAAGSTQLAADARTSAASASGSRGEAAGIGSRIATVARASREVSASAQESRAAAMSGAKSLRDAIESMATIGDAVQRASDTVNELGTYGQQIGAIVQVIDDIAAQTNLLALNAAIESARAGEHGRGFAVVAENVRQLAQRSSDSTKEIADLIAKVQQGTRDAVAAMSSGVNDVQAGRAVAAEASDAIASIIGSVERSAEAMGQIATDVQDLASGAGRIVEATESIAALAASSAASAEGMADGTERVSNAIARVAEMSERTSAATEQVSASTQELTAQSGELSNTAARMRELAAELEASAGKFRWDRRHETLPVEVERRKNGHNVLSA